MFVPEAFYLRVTSLMPSPPSGREAALPLTTAVAFCMWLCGGSRVLCRSRGGLASPSSFLSHPQTSPGTWSLSVPPRLGWAEGCSLPWGACVSRADPSGCSCGASRGRGSRKGSRHGFLCPWRKEGAPWPHGTWAARRRVGGGGWAGHQSPWLGREQGFGQGGLWGAPFLRAPCRAHSCCAFTAGTWGKVCAGGVSPALGWGVPSVLSLHGGLRKVGGWWERCP